MSPISRRSLLQAATAGGAVAGIGGFSALSQFFAPLLAGDPDGLAPFQAPAADEIDDASHVLNRLTFGPRPGQHAEISALGAREFISANSIPKHSTTAGPTPNPVVSKPSASGRSANCSNTMPANCSTS